MKQCPKCGRKYNDTVSYCIDCGVAVTKSNKSYKIKTITIASVLILIITALVCIPLISWYNTKSELEDAKNQQILEDMVEERNKPNSSDLTITDHHQFNSGYSYGYVKGTVKNTSKKTIKSFKIVVKLKDSSHTVIASDYDFYYGSLYPGDETDFEIMYKRPSRSVDNYSLYIEDVE